MNRTLLSTDKNGTKVWSCTDKCFKCGGKGVIPHFYFYAGGECFECGGSGIVQWTEKEYTPEYAKKLEERRIKRQEKKLAEARAKAVEKNAEFFERNGFNADGKTYFVLGNTFAIKDELKAKGAKFDSRSKHWHMAQDLDEYNTVEISVDEMYYADAADTYYWNNWKSDCAYCDKISKAESDTKRGTEAESEYIGAEGDKVTVVVTYVHTSSFESVYGVTHLHTFKDDNGNVIIWKTANYIEADYGMKLTVTGTVKAHNEYKSTKQTVLTRCKVQGV